MRAGSSRLKAQLDRRHGGRKMTLCLGRVHRLVWSEDSMPREDRSGWREWRSGVEGPSQPHRSWWGERQE